MKTTFSTFAASTSLARAFRSPGESDDSLDLFGVPCEHRDGVYTVIARVTSESDCHSTYIAAPPDRSFALCLNLY